jgi:hypothetical protein
MSLTGPHWGHHIDWRTPTTGASCHEIIYFIHDEHDDSQAAAQRPSIALDPH